MRVLLRALIHYLYPPQPRRGSVGHGGARSAAVRKRFPPLPSLRGREAGGGIDGAAPGDGWGGGGFGPRYRGGPGRPWTLDCRRGTVDLPTPLPLPGPPDAWSRGATTRESGKTLWKCNSLSLRCELPASSRKKLLLHLFFFPFSFLPFFLF